MFCKAKSGDFLLIITLLMVFRFPLKPFIQFIQYLHDFFLNKKEQFFKTTCS